MRREFAIVADNVRSLENIGAIFRIADGLGACEVICVGIAGYPDMGESDTRRPYLRQKNHTAIQKTALSGIGVPFRYFANTVECIDYLKKSEYYIVVLEQTPKSLNINENFELKNHFALVVGHEVDGVSNKFIETCDLAVEIPMKGNGKSLNVAVACGVASFELQKKLNY